jgi:hypothetical protein
MPIAPLDISPSIATRGVYSSAWTAHGGETILVAVTASGRRLAEATVIDGADAELMAAFLWAILDRHDPVADTLPLRLVS